MSMKHATITQIAEISVDTTQIDTRNYTEQLRTVKVETEKRIISDDKALLADTLKCLDVITSRTTDEVTISIKRTNEGLLIKKRWTTRKEQY